MASMVGTRAVLLTFSVCTSSQNPSCTHFFYLTLDGFSPWLRIVIFLGLGLGIVTVAAKAELVSMSNGLRVMADVSFADAPKLDVIIVPGGPGWVKACDDKTILDYLSRTAKHARIVSGALPISATM